MTSVLWSTIFIPVVLVSCQSLTDQNGTTQQCGTHICPFWSTCTNNSLTGDLECGACMVGFVRNNTDCSDRDECTFLGYDPCARFGTGACVNTLGGFNCSCLVGWTGPRCQFMDENVTASDRACLPGYVNQVYNDTYGECKDIDECSKTSTSTCGLHQHCVNTAGSYKCDCDSGWHGSNCTEDTDECKTPSPCNSHQHCVNTIGSFHCDCNSGWEGFVCNNDTNECNNANACYLHQHCLNTAGSYQCECDNGWTGPHCDLDIDECETTSPCTGLQIKCVNDPGSYRCECITGWEGDNCTTDINECANTSICGPHQRCMNTLGSYKCDCDNGWEGVNCTDIDECTNTDMCGQHQNCVNTVGSFRCDCDIGWEGVNCSVDIDECTNTHMCGKHQNCVNTVGSFRCDCDIGWEGVNCSVDIDECTHTHMCGKHQNCVNTVGNFRCDCDIGWEGVNCSVDIDECTNAHICGPNQQCLNIFGSFRCDCDIGWQGNNCSIDIDECTNASSCGAHQHCVNSVGTYICLEGYIDTSTKYTNANYLNQELVTSSDLFRSSTADNAKNRDGGLMQIVQRSEHVKGNSDDQQDTKLDVVLGSVFGTVAFISGFLVALIAYRKCSKKNKVGSKNEHADMCMESNGLPRVFIIDKDGRFKTA